ncbi:MAG: C-terminal binding protein [Thermomicrobiales bacterium]
MSRSVTVTITSDRYGGGSATFDLERGVVAAYPDLDVDLRGAEPHSAEDMIALGQHSDAMLLSTRDALPRAVLANIPRVKVIGRYGVGMDNVDLAAATEFGIVVTHYPQYCTYEVADHATAFILALNRRIVELDRDLRGGAWIEHGADTDSILRGPVPALRELTIGIVGLGAIGRAVARRLLPHGCRVLATDPFVSPEEMATIGVEAATLEDLLRQADIVTLHCPLLPPTHGLIGESQLALMKPDATIVNTARGPVIRGVDLIAHLQAHPGFRAALDVVEHEPLAADSPLYGLPNVILSPHAAYYSTRSVDTVQRETLIGALDTLRGVRPLTVANPAVLETVMLCPNPRAGEEF